MPQHSNNRADGDRGKAIADPATEPFGSWTYRLGDGKLSWTNQLFGLFGFPINEVVPTLQLMSSHQHPADRASWDQQVRTVLTVGDTVGVWHRVIDAQMRHRNLYTVLSATTGEDGSVVSIGGLMTDLTARLEQDRSQAATEAVTRSAQTRGLVDQAKGIIMATMNVEARDAFDLLRWHASHMNVELREVAAAVVSQRAELAAPNSAASPRERLSATITGLAASSLSPLPAARSVSDPAIDIDIDQETARTGRISPASLPRTMIRAVAAASQSISIADYTAPDQPLVYVNRAFETLTGYSAQDILGRNCRFLQGCAPSAESAAESAAVAAVRSAITGGGEIRTVLRNYRRDGTAFWNELHLSAVRDTTGQITHYVGYQTDVSERVEREQQLEHLASHDARTNLPNQPAAVAHLHRLLTSGEQGAGWAVTRVHLSGFRAAGGFDDPAVIRTVLATAAQRLQAAFGPPAYLAKLDEDTFLMVLPGPGGLDTAPQVLADPIPLTNGPIQLTVRVEQIEASGVAALAQTLNRP